MTAKKKDETELTTLPAVPADASADSPAPPLVSTYDQLAEDAKQAATPEKNTKKKD